MSVVGTLSVRITGDTGELDKSLSESNTKVAKWAAAAAVAAGTVAVAFIRSGAQSADALAKFAAATDSSIVAVQGLERAAGRAGVSAEQMRMTIQRMNRALGDAVTRGGESEKALEMLGLSASYLTNLPVDERLAIIADRIKEMGLNSSEAASILGALGVRQLNIQNLLRQGGEQFRQSTQRIKDYGIALDEISAKAIEEANDEMAEFGIIIQGIAQQLAGRVAPVVRDFALGLQQAFINAGGATVIIEKGLYATQKAAEIAAVIVASRLVPGLVAATGAKVAAAAAALRYQIALASMAGVSATAAAAQGALAVAVRGASAAMLLLGGPAGALVLAAGALFVFRKELGIGVTPVTQMRDQINELAGSYRMLGTDALEAAILEAEATQLRLQNLKAQLAVQDAMGNQENPFFMDLNEEELRNTNFALEEQNELLAQMRERLLELRGGGEGEEEGRAGIGLLLGTEESRESDIEAYENYLLAIQELEAIYHANKQLAEEQFSDWSLKNHESYLKSRVKLTENAEKAEQDMRTKTANLSVGLLQMLGQKNKAFALIALAITKARAISETIINTQVAAQLAFASQLVPGLPWTLGTAKAAYAATMAQGKIQMGLIAATGLMEAGQIMQSGGGGISMSGSSVGGTPESQAAATMDASTGRVIPPQTVTITLQGEVFGREQVRNLIGEINEAICDGAVLRLT